MKITSEIKSDFIIGGKMSLYNQDMIKNEPQFPTVSLSFALKNGGPIIKEFINLLNEDYKNNETSIRLHSWNKKHLVNGIKPKLYHENLNDTAYYFSNIFEIIDDEYNEELLNNNEYLYSLKTVIDINNIVYVNNKTIFRINKEDRFEDNFIFIQATKNDDWLIKHPDYFVFDSYNQEMKKERKKIQDEENKLSYGKNLK